MLVIIGITTNNAYSVGLGWAAIEIIYGLIQITGLGILQQRHDAEAKKAKVLLSQMGLDKAFQPSTPFWGALERVSVGAIHIGLNLALVFTPFMLLITVPLHSFINFAVVRMNKKSISNSQISLLLIAVTILAIGILLS